MPARQTRKGFFFDWAQGENGWKTGHDQTIQNLQYLVQPKLVRADLTTPPSSPQEGDLYFIPTGSTPVGAWASQAGKLAGWDGSGWDFLIPEAGWEFEDASLGVKVRFDGASFVEVVVKPKSHTQGIETITGLQSQLDSINSDIAGLESADSGIDARVDVIEATIPSLASKADLANSANPSLGSSLIGHSGQSLKTKLDTIDSAISSKEPAIPTGSSAQYIRGDKTLSSFNADVDARAALSSAAVRSDLAEIADPAKGTALIGHEGQVLKTKLDSVDSQIATLQAGQGSGSVAYATRAILEADLSKAEGTLGTVTNDPTPTNNTTYRKVGAPGLGSWVISSEGPLDAYKAYVRDTLIKQDTATYPRSGWAWAVRDDLERVAIGIDDAGALWIGGKQYAMVDLAQPRSGYSWALTDEAGRVVLGVDHAGELVVRGRRHPISMEAALPRTGYSWALTDEAGRVAFGIDYAGRVVVNGQLLTDMINGVEDTSAEVAVLQKKVDGLSSIVCWGDSMTQGVNPATPYPALLANLTGRTVNNRGIGGQRSHEIIARQGGNAILLTAAGNQIPASGSVAVTLTGSNPLSVYSPQSMAGTLSGIAGLLNRAGDGSLSFTRIDAGVAKKIDPKTPFFINKDADDAYRIHVLWLGRNNLDEVSRILSDYDAAIAYIKSQNKRFLLIPPFNGQNEPAGNYIYNWAIEVRDALQAKYPNEFIDLRRRIVESYNPGLPQDVIDHANDCPPSSLLLSPPGDPLHLNTAGNTLIAQWVADEILNRGW